jgi:hypothetical protein
MLAQNGNAHSESTAQSARNTELHPSRDAVAVYRALANRDPIPTRLTPRKAPWLLDKSMP